MITIKHLEQQDSSSKSMYQWNESERPILGKTFSSKEDESKSDVFAFGGQKMVWCETSQKLGTRNLITRLSTEHSNESQM